MKTRNFAKVSALFTSVIFIALIVTTDGMKLVESILTIAALSVALSLAIKDRQKKKRVERLATFLRYSVLTLHSGNSIFI